MWTLRNLKLQTLSTVVPLMERGACPSPLSVPVVHHQVFCFADVEMEVVVLAPRCQGSDHLSVDHLIVAGDQADDGCAI